VLAPLHTVNFRLFESPASRLSSTAGKYRSRAVLSLYATPRTQSVCRTPPYQLQAKYGSLPEGTPPPGRFLGRQLAPVSALMPR